MNVVVHWDSKRKHSGVYYNIPLETQICTQHLTLSCVDAIWHSLTRDNKQAFDNCYNYCI
jgi:hypothetical protein